MVKNAREDRKAEACEPAAMDTREPSLESSSALAPADREDAFRFGERLRAHRKDKGWSLEKAAKVVGVPASTLSRIENRKMSPTLELIQKIVRNMGWHPYEALGRAESGANSGTVSVTRRGAEELTELPNIFYAPLHPDIRSAVMRPILVTLFARSVDEYGGLTAHEGEEFLYVLNGELELHLEGRAPERLSAGDTIYFDSHIPHAYVTVGNSQAKFLIVASTVDVPFGHLSR